MGEVLPLVRDGKPVLKRFNPLPTDTANMTDVQREYVRFLRMTALEDRELFRTVWWAAWDAATVTLPDAQLNDAYNEGFADGIDSR
jgi:hypothetical protein